MDKVKVIKGSIKALTVAFWLDILVGLVNGVEFLAKGNWTFAWLMVATMVVAGAAYVSIGWSKSKLAEVETHV